MKIIFQLLTLLALFVPCSAAEQSNIVKAGDVLKITMKGVPASDEQMVSGAYPVGTNGQIKMPSLQRMIQASGSTPTAIARRIEQAYIAEQIYTQPAVSIITDRLDKIAQDDLVKVVTVTGQVGRQGPVNWRKGMTINEAVATANPTTFAKKKAIILVRKGKKYTVDVTNTQQMMILVQPDDQIVVPLKKW